MRLLTSLAVLAVTVSSPVLAKECRIPDPAPGVPVHLPRECNDSVRSKRFEATKQDYVKRNQGFIDLGNGTQVRIGGRVRAEVGIGR